MEKQQYHDLKNLQDYDPNDNDKYYRQTLYKVIGWLSEEVRKLRSRK